jgi:hypothetical protein
MKLAGAQVGTISYSTGVMAFTDACPVYGTASKVVSFTPAALPLRVEDTAAQVVTVENRGFVWVLTLAPIPSPGSLRVSYRVNNAWYTIIDGGGGALAGADSSYGTGTVDFTTGTVVLQTGELPDVGSDILYAWSTAVNYTARANETVAAPIKRFVTANPHVLPGTVEVSWVDGATTYTLTDAAGDGKLTGTGGKGAIQYATGKGWVQSALVPAMGTDFNVAYEYGDPVDLVTEDFSGVALNADGLIEFTLDELPKPGTLTINVAEEALDYVSASGEISEAVAPAVPIVPGVAMGVMLVFNSCDGHGYYGNAFSKTTFSSEEDALAAKIAVENANPVSFTVPGDFTVAGTIFYCEWLWTFNDPGVGPPIVRSQTTDTWCVGQVRTYRK